MQHAVKVRMEAHFDKTRKNTHTNIKGLTKCDNSDNNLI